nr:PREDICTED: protein FAM214A [Bemisia tabaci]XP_018896797.1 PREDICTED: protein FAM214A [Bemisia tabaci]XP_018896806.1 PREDICTED: protein FAM214A [Bemisia tabaci]XP_018896815.1 PREDICTED: protein FAM214A [Bemisia tabaci]XP_018896826.1 PREDICTED: protein FAM214A [Bemisia tabaci]
MHSVHPESSISKSPEVLSLVVDLGTLIVEGRTRQRNAKGGFLEGPHCPNIGFPTPSNHVCDINNEQCAWIQRLRLQIALLWKNFGSFCIELTVSPDCGLCGEFNQNSSSDHIIEQWFITADTKKKEDNFVITGNHFFQAIRSQLHFSQLTAWWHKNGGTNPARVGKKVANVSAVNSSFSQSANVHTFPLLNVGLPEYIKVTVLSAPRSEQPPSVRCTLHSVIGIGGIQMQGIGVAEDRVKPCDKPGKHRCECKDELVDEAPRSRRRRKLSDLLTLNGNLSSMKNLSIAEDANKFKELSSPDDILRKRALWGLNMDEKLLSDDFSKWSFVNLSKTSLSNVADSFSLKQSEPNDVLSFQLSSQEIEEVLTVLRCPRSLSSQHNQFGEYPAQTLTKDSADWEQSNFREATYLPWPVPRKISDVNKSAAGLEKMSAECSTFRPPYLRARTLATKPEMVFEPIHDLNSIENTVNDQTSQTNNLSTPVIKYRRGSISFKAYPNSTRVGQPVDTNKNRTECESSEKLFVDLHQKLNDKNNNSCDTSKSTCCESPSVPKSEPFTFTNSKTIKHGLRIKTLHERCLINNINNSKSNNIFNNVNSNVINNNSCSSSSSYSDNLNNLLKKIDDCDIPSLSNACAVKTNSQASTPYQTPSRKNSGDFSGDEYSFENGSRPVPSALDKEKFRRSLDSAASMVFHHRTGLPLANSPAPARRPASTHFDFDSSINSVSAIRCALYDPSPCESESEGNSPVSTEPKYSLSWPSPQTNSSLLGNFEESVLNGRLEPVSTVHGFTADLGASGAFCPSHLILPVTVFFYTLGDRDKVSAPYLAHINLGKKGYVVPRSGTIQVTLMNPLGTVIKMFVVAYDLSDMPPNTHTFLRQRTLYMPANSNHIDRKWLRYLIHLRFSSSKSGRISLHTDIRMIIFCKSDLDTATEHKTDTYELRSFLHGPSNPKFSPRK